MIAESQSLAFLLTWATTSRAVRWSQSRSWAAQILPSSGSLFVSKRDGPEQGLLGRGGDDALAGLVIEGIERLVDLVDVLGIGLDVVDLGELDGALGDVLGPLPAPLAEPLLDRLGPGEQGGLPAVELFQAVLTSLVRTSVFSSTIGLYCSLGMPGERNCFTSLSTW